jgi:hypothetical protein
LSNGDHPRRGRADGSSVAILPRIKAVGR